MATVPQINHVKDLIDTNATVLNTIVADDNALLAAIIAYHIVSPIDTAIKKNSLLAKVNVATHPLSHGHVNGIVIAPVATNVRATYVIKKAEAVRQASTNALAMGVRQDFTQHALSEVTKFATISVADIGAALTAIQANANKFQTALIIAGMTSGITAAAFNDDAPWAAITYAEFAITEKRALRGLINELKTNVDHVTAFNRCGFILSGLVGEKTGSWISKFGMVTKSNQASWWPPMHKWAASMPNSVKSVVDKRINAQKEWCAAHSTELAALIAAVVL